MNYSVLRQFTKANFHGLELKLNANKWCRNPDALGQKTNLFLSFFVFFFFVLSVLFYECLNEMNYSVLRQFTKANFHGSELKLNSNKWCGHPDALGQEKIYFCLFWFCLFYLNLSEDWVFELFGLMFKSVRGLFCVKVSICSNKKCQASFPLIKSRRGQKGVRM